MYYFQINKFIELNLNNLTKSRVHLNNPLHVVRIIF